jgi:uncharacterized membrane protein
VETSRAQAFSDGVFAIAITLLILNVTLHRSGGTLGHDLLDLWPSYFAYAISFLTIGIMWVNHHTIFRHIERVDRVFLLLNLMLLMCIAFVPFPTGVAARFARSDEDRQAAALLYGITLTITAVFFISLWLYASRRGRLLAPHADRREVSGITRSYIPGAPMYATATLVAFVDSRASLILFAVITVFYALSSSLFGREE